MIRAGVRRFLWLALRRHDRWEREVEEEIKLHLTMRAEQLVAEGRGSDEAYAEAVRRFGPLSESRARLVDAARHRETRMQRTEYLDDLRQDTVFAVRTLGRQKSWTAIFILTLALGIGAITAVFSVVSRLLLHPLPYPHADRIVWVDQQPSQGNNTGITVTIAASAPVVRAWRADNHVFEALEPVSNIRPRTLKTVSGEPSYVFTASILPSFATFADERPIRGRMFTDTDIRNGGMVAVLGESFWRERFGANPGVLGKVVTLGDSSYTIIGVMPASFRFGSGALSPTDVWLPLDLRNDKLGMSVIARLRPGVTPQSAMRELDSIFARSSGFTDPSHIPFRSVVTSPAARLGFHDSLVLLSWAVALVLLVACTNGAHLLLARSSTRQREIAIRAALGAGRGRVLRQLLTESFVLCVAGTICGIALGWVALRVLIALRPSRLDPIKLAQLDPTTLGVAIAVAVVTAIAFALIGGMQAARHASPDLLRSGIAMSPMHRAGRGRGVLVVSEMALSGVLLVGAALLVRSVVNLERADLGFDPRGLYVQTIPLEDSLRFPTDEVRAGYAANLVRRVRALPQVQALTVANVAPGSRWFSIGRLEVEGESRPPKSTTEFVDVNFVQRDYFQSMGITLRSGTTFTDTTEAAHQIIVNESFARKHWAPGSALGQHIRIAQTDSEPWMTIVGVVHDASLSGPTSESTAPMLYAPRTKTGSTNLLIRLTPGSDARALQPVVDMIKQSGIKRVPPPESVESNISKSIAAPRFVMLLLAILTSLALVLSSIGLYGVMSYSVAQQTRDIGIRVALGASDARIARGVLGRASALAVVGAVIGLVSAGWATNLIESQLYGVTRLDPVAFGAGAIVLIGSAIVASVVPTRRALSVDPMTAIRAE